MNCGDGQLRSAGAAARNSRTTAIAPWASRPSGSPFCEAHKALGGADRRIKPLPEGDRNDAVELAVQHQSRDRDRADPRIRAELILHQKTNRDQRIAQLGDLGGGSERRFQNQPSDWCSLASATATPVPMICPTLLFAGRRSDPCRTHTPRWRRAEVPSRSAIRSSRPSPTGC